VVITPDKYNATPVYDLLKSAAAGMIGVDHRFLKSIVERGEAALDDVVRFGKENRPADRVNLDDDLVAISQYLGSPKALPLLVELLRREPLDPSEDLIHAFLRIGDAGIDPLLKLYGDLGPEDGGDVAFILAAFRKQDPRILELLEERLRHDPQDAVFLMGIHCDPAAKPILEVVRKNADAVDGGDPAVAKEAAEALEAIATPPEPEPPEPVSLWDLYPEHIEPVFDVMTLEERLEFLRCSSAELRADAATSFIDREVPDEAADVLIELARTDPNVGVRAVACEALSSLVDRKEVRTLLLETLGSQKPIPERCGALLALAPRTKEIPAVKEYISEFYANPGTQARALEAMWRSMDRDFTEHFRRHLNDADVDVRRQAIKGVGYLEMSAEASQLVDLFRDEEFRLDALFSYALCVPVKRLQRGDATEILRRIDEMAGGLSEAESEVVETALDTRLMLHGLEPVFLPLEDESDA
jgi:HEAT repeat protein